MTRWMKRKQEILLRSKCAKECLRFYRLPGLTHKAAAGSVNVPVKDSMPLPPGLIPTGTFSDAKPSPGIPKPTSSAFPQGGSAGLKSLQS